MSALIDWYFSHQINIIKRHTIHLPKAQCKWNSNFDSEWLCTYGETINGTHYFDFTFGDCLYHWFNSGDNFNHICMYLYHDWDNMGNDLFMIIPVSLPATTYGRVTLQRDKILSNAEYNNAMTHIKHGSGFISVKDTPYLALRGELWDAFCAKVAKNTSLRQRPSI